MTEARSVRNLKGGNSEFLGFDLGNRRICGACGGFDTSEKIANNYDHMMIDM